MCRKQRLSSVDLATDELLQSVTYVINAKVFGPLLAVLMLFAPIVDLKKDKGRVQMSAEKVQQRLAVGEDPARSDFWINVLSSQPAPKLSPLPCPERSTCFRNTPMFSPSCATSWIAPLRRRKISQWLRLQNCHIFKEYLTRQCACIHPFLAV